MVILKKAYAKINMSLKILHRRNDGYHEILTLMRRISLADEVKLTISPKGSKISIGCSNKDIANRQNTAHRAAEMFLERAKISAGVDIEIDKKIPMQAGLGGGSSDAAAVLLALSEFYPALPEDELLGIAANVGADVPFFFKNVSCAICGGIGEIVTPINSDAPGRCLVAKPNFGISTKQAYEDWDKFAENRAKEKITNSAISKITENDFAKLAFSQNAGIKRICGSIMGSGAKSAGLCGSGSALFGIFEDEALAGECARALRQNPEIEFCGVFDFL